MSNWSEGQFFKIEEWKVSVIFLLEFLEILREGQDGLRVLELDYWVENILIFW